MKQPPLIGFGYNTPTGLPARNLRTVSGASPLRLPNSAARKPRSLAVYGNTVDGAGVGDYDPTDGSYSIPVTVRGINLLDTTRERTVLSGSLPGGEYTAGTGTLSFSTAYYSSSTVYGIKTELSPDTTYTLSYNLVTGKALIRVYSESGSVITTSRDSEITFNSRSNSTVYIEFRSNSWNLHTKITDILLSESGTDRYEPYIAPCEYLVPLSRPVYDGECIYIDTIRLIQGTSVIDVKSEVAPALIECKYYLR
ncbi:MAG: hypothetical protein IJH94_07435 [Clostridia bacterium]|nr:hypothetical protein [Clostridia bacterium]